MKYRIESLRKKLVSVSITAVLATLLTAPSVQTAFGNPVSICSGNGQRSESSSGGFRVVKFELTATANNNGTNCDSTFAVPTGVTQVEFLLVSGGGGGGHDGGGGGGGGGGAGGAYDYISYKWQRAYNDTPDRGGLGALGKFSTIYPGCFATGGGGGGAIRAGGICATSDATRPTVWESITSTNNNGSGLIQGGHATNGTGSGGGGAANASGLGYGGAGGSGIIVVQIVTMPNFGEPEPVETVTAGVVHRFNFTTSSTPGVTRSFYWEHTNGVANTWTALANTAAFYDFTSPGSSYLETTTSGSAYSFRVTVTDTTDSTGVASAQRSAPFYVVVSI